MCVQMQWVTVQDSDIASALVRLFNAFAQQAQGHLQAEVDPTQLREALSRLPGNKFGVGEHAIHWVLLPCVQVYAIGA